MSETALIFVAVETTGTRATRDRITEIAALKVVNGHLDSIQLVDLPASPGVYLFYGHNRLPLYVGKSINVRSRVLGHFQRDHQDDREMRLAQQVQHIEWEATAGDLGAQLREAQQLCPRVLGLEKGKGRCFANQIGKCRGACNGQESITTHTQRAQAALSQLQVNVWPWPSSIAIEEQPVGNTTPAWHVVRQWCYLGSASSAVEAQALAQAPATFDMDNYRILNRFLRCPEQHGLTVTPLN